MNNILSGACILRSKGIHGDIQICGMESRVNRTSLPQGHSQMVENQEPNGLPSTPSKNPSYLPEGKVNSW